MISISALGHRLAHLPVHDVPAVAVQHAAQIVERAADVDVGNIDVPVLMRLVAAARSPSLSSTACPSTRQQPRLPSTRQTLDGLTATTSAIQHHERQPPVTFQRILQMEIDDRLLLPLLQPEVPGNPSVVLVRLAVSLPPVVELAGWMPSHPMNRPAPISGLLRPAPDKIHDLVPHVVRHPDPGQSSPRLFFSATCSAISSARTSSLVWIFFSRYSMRSCSAWWLGRALWLEGRRPVLEELLLPAVEHRRLQPQFVAQLRNRLLVQQMPPQDGDLLFCGVVLPCFLHAFSPLS